MPVTDTVLAVLFETDGGLVVEVFEGLEVEEEGDVVWAGLGQGGQYGGRG